MNKKNVFGIIWKEINYFVWYELKIKEKIILVDFTKMSLDTN